MTLLEVKTNTIYLRRGNVFTMKWTSQELNREVGVQSLEEFSEDL